MQDEIVMTLVDLVAIFGTAQAVLIALVTYLGKLWLARFEQRIKTDHDVKLKDLEDTYAKGLKRLESELRSAREKSVYIHKVQYDTEAKIYRELWAKLGQLRYYVTLFNASQNQDTNEWQWEDRQKEYLDLFGEFRECIEQNELFIAPAIFKEVNDLLNILFWAEERENWNEDYSIGKRLSDVQSGSSKISELIRYRLTRPVIE